MLFRSNINKDYLYLELGKMVLRLSWKNKYERRPVKILKKGLKIKKEIKVDRTLDIKSTFSRAHKGAPGPSPA